MLWHQGLDLTTPLAGKTNALLDKRQGGVNAYYTVLVTNQSNGCQNTVTALIADDREYPVVTLTSTDNTKCVAPYDGAASLTSLTYNGSPIAAPYTGYSFDWSNGATTASLTQQQAGSFTLEVTKVDVGCTSAPVIADVQNNLFIPPINITSTDQTSCDVNSPNGILTATINETTIGGGAAVNSNYNFVWRNNGAGPVLVAPGTTVASTTATNGQVNQLPGNLYYTVSATRASTGCVNTETIFLPEVITYPIVVATTTNPVTRCDVPNGAIAATVGGSAAGYTFYWLNETGPNQTALNTTVVSNADNTFVDNGQYNNLNPGYYTVVARDNFTTCLSQPVTREVLNAIVQTNINITLGPGFPSTCGSFDGEMTGNVTGGSGGTVNLFWHYGGPVNSNINFFDNPPVFSGAPFFDGDRSIGSCGVAYYQPGVENVYPARA